MLEKTKIRAFVGYANYWLIKLELNKKYNIIVKKDNRIGTGAEVFRQENEYIIQYNTKLLSSKVDIIHSVLHEIGHLLVDFRYGDEAEQEYAAELFALKTAKEHYPKIYPKMIKSSIYYVTKVVQDSAHIKGYKKALKELGEI